MLLTCFSNKLFYICVYLWAGPELKLRNAGCRVQRGVGLGVDHPYPCYAFFQWVKLLVPPRQDRSCGLEVPHCPPLTYNDRLRTQGPPKCNQLSLLKE